MLSAACTCGCTCSLPMLVSVEGTELRDDPSTVKSLEICEVTLPSPRDGARPKVPLCKVPNPFSDPREVKSMASWSREWSKADTKAEDWAIKVVPGSTLRREVGGSKLVSGPSSKSGGSADDGLEGGGVGTPMPK